MSTLSAIDIAHWWKDEPSFPHLGQLKQKSWPAPGSCYVECQQFIDFDFEWAALLRVDTIPERATTHIEVLDWLLVYEYYEGGERKLDVMWKDDPRLFFDGDTDWYEEGASWFVSQVYELRREAWERTAKANPEAAERTRASNAKNDIPGRDRAAAIRDGIVLPYMKNF